MSSDTPTIEQMNEVIARFDGRKLYGRYTIDNYGGDTHMALPEMKYHTSWDWLKPVIDEIFKYYLAYPYEVRPVIEMKIVVGIKPAHEKVYQFCKWINQQKQTNATTE